MTVYECKCCAYSCTNLSNFRKHLQTKKHKKMADRCGLQVSDSNEDVVCDDSEYDMNGAWICECGKSYKHRSGLSRHRKVCTVSNESFKPLDPASESIRSTLNQVVEENRELRELIIKQQEQIEKSIQPHNTYNLQVFLTEGCKDAINMSEFISSLPIEMHDLEHTRKHGFYQGIAQIMVNGLKQLGITKRPIHCTDIKQETLCIKDNDTWARGEECKDKLQWSLQSIAMKQRKAIKEWELANPHWEKSDVKTQEWIQLVKNVMTGVGDDRAGEGMILKVIAKETHVPCGKYLTNA